MSHKHEITQEDKYILQSCINYPRPSMDDPGLTSIQRQLNNDHYGIMQHHHQFNITNINNNVLTAQCM